MIQLHLHLPPLLRPFQLLYLHLLLHHLQFVALHASLILELELESSINNTIITPCWYEYHFCSYVCVA